MIREVPGRRPSVDSGAYVDPQAAVIGDVVLNGSNRRTPVKRPPTPGSRRRRAAPSAR